VTESFVAPSSRSIHRVPTATPDCIKPLPKSGFLKDTPPSAKAEGGIPVKNSVHSAKVA
jgi:hypothetical protein